MHRGAWWATVPRVAKSRARLRDFTFTFFHFLAQKQICVQISAILFSDSVNSTRYGNFFFFLPDMVTILKLNIQKTQIMASGPITSWQIDRETVQTVADFIFWAPKSLQMVIAAMKLKDAYSLEGKLSPT